MLDNNLKNWFIGKLALARPVCEISPLLNRLTVVIPTFERQEYLLRAILYWSNSPVTLIIADGSKESLPKEIVEHISKRSNITYLHNLNGIENRLSQVTKFVKTEFAVTMADDEFHLKSGILDAIHKLDEHPDAVGCIGQSIRFAINSVNFELKYGQGYPHKDYHINQDNIGDRLIAAMRQYNAATCYAVMRGECWKKSWGRIGNYSSPYVSEIQQALTCYIMGKFISTNALYWLRSFEVMPIHDNKKFNRKLSFNDWWENNNFKVEKENFIDLLVSVIIENEGISLDQARFQIMTGIHEYLECCRRQSLLNYSFNSNFRQFSGRLIRKILSEDAIDKIKILFGKSVRYTVHAEFNYGTLNDLIAKNFDLPYKFSQELVDELRFVESIIKEFNQIKV